jgi:hypothetical protein
MQLLLEMLAALDPDVALVDLTQEDLLILLDNIVTDDDIWSKENAKNLFQSIMPEGLVSNRQSRLDCIPFQTYRLCGHEGGVIKCIRGWGQYQ